MTNPRRRQVIIQRERETDGGRDRRNGEGETNEASQTGSEEKEGKCTEDTSKKLKPVKGGAQRRKGACVCVCVCRERERELLRRTSEGNVHCDQQHQLSSTEKRKKRGEKKRKERKRGREIERKKKESQRKERK